MSSSSSGSSSSDSTQGESDAEDVWVEKSALNDADKFKKPATVKSKKHQKENTGDDESQIGPTLRNTSNLTHKDFGHALLPGEGAAMVSKP